MMPERLEGLLWERIDGTISADDRAELEDHLAANSEAKKLAEELVDLNDLLVTIPSVPSPAGLRAAIDRGLAGARTPAGSTTTQSVVTHRRVADSWRSRLLPLAAGLLIGAAVVQLLHMGAAGPVKDSSVMGTMAATSVRGAASVIDLDLGADVGTVHAGRDGVVLTVEAELTGPAEVQLVLEVTSGDILLVGTSQAQTSASRVSADRGRVALTAEGPGRHRLVVEATHKDTQARLTVRVGHETVAERWLEPVVGEDQP